MKTAIIIAVTKFQVWHTWSVWDLGAILKIDAGLLLQRGLECASVWIGDLAVGSGVTFLESGVVVVVVVVVVVDQPCLELVWKISFRYKWGTGFVAQVRLHLRYRLVIV